MYNKRGFKLLIILLSFAFCMNSYAQKVVTKTFSAKESIKINLVSGDCVVKSTAGNDIKVYLSYSYPDDCFKYKFKELGGELEIREKVDGRCSGESDWEIEVPKNVKVHFNSASGNLEINGIENNVSSNTASGDVKISNINGDVELNTASGDVAMDNITGSLKITTASGDVKVDELMAESSISTASGDVAIERSIKELKIRTASGDISIENSKGLIKAKCASGEISIESSVLELHAATASGDIELENVQLTAASEAKAASGNIEISLTKSLIHDLALSTASGNVKLDYNGNAVKGFFEFMAKEDKGKIVSPFNFDKEEKVERNGETYDKKSFTKGGASPRVYLKTSNGTVVLMK